ncbi:putative outer membrane protein [Moraxella catarrhalis]|nr:putative outer membrane protein [Moraxella catarrhalis]
MTAAVAGAQIVLNSYRRQFIAGRKSWLEVLNSLRDQAQYEQQLRHVQTQMVANFYKLQVDFALMPWQKESIRFIQKPVGEFAPFGHVKDELNQYLSSKQSPQPSASVVSDQYIISQPPPIEPMIRDVTDTTDAWQYHQEDQENQPNIDGNKAALDQKNTLDDEPSKNDHSLPPSQ